MAYSFNNDDLFGNIRQLPLELVADIQGFTERELLPRPRASRERAETAGDPSQPPEDKNKRPFLSLPRELRAHILAGELPERASVIRPTCGGHIQKDPKRAVRHNRVSDLMLIHKDAKHAVTLAVYQEREFEIHVHQGTSTAGIEFLDAGRQPLHYQLDTSDDRFERFTTRGDFGFQQLKKIHIKIYQPEEGQRRLVTLNTYYMHQALCRLLQRDTEKERDRIVSITISFAKAENASPLGVSGRQQIMAHENYWWHPEDSKPRSSCVEGLSDFQIALWPFSHLTKVHRVTVELPKGLHNDPQSMKFSDDLIRSMTSKTAGMVSQGWTGGENLERNVQGLRDSSEDFAILKMHGGKHNNAVAKLSVEEMTQVENDEDDSEAGDGIFELYRSRGEYAKRDRSPPSVCQGPDSSKRQKFLKQESSLGIDLGQMDLGEQAVQHVEEDWRDGHEQWDEFNRERASDRSINAASDERAAQRARVRQASEKAQQSRPSD